MNIIKRCPYCNSIWVCWNWILAFRGDRKKFEEANLHLNPKDLKDWGHECWDCDNVIKTHKKVRNGLPYWVLKTFHKFRNRKGDTCQKWDK